MKLTPRPQTTTDYLVIDHGALVDTQLWRGATVIGSEAIYLFKEGTGIETHQRTNVLIVLLQLLERLAERLFPPRTLAGGRYTDIPASVRSRDTWPIRTPADCPVLIIPREAVAGIQHARGAHEMALSFNGTPILIRWGQFGANKIKDFLVAKGWPLLWKRELSHISPTHAAALPPLRKPRIAVCLFLTAFFMVCATIAFECLPSLQQFDFLIIIFLIVAVLSGLLGGIALFRRI
jgi:hypothetical protein